jgi:hypothetical protein
MNGFVPLLAALALAQGDPPPAPPAGSAEPAPPAASAPTAVAEPAPPPAPSATKATADPAPPPAPPPAPSAAAGGAAGGAAPAPPRAKAPPPAPPRDPASPAERAEAERAARAFLDALAAGSADGLAQAAADRFSFDGEPQAGRDAIRRTWRALLAGREGPPPRVGSVEVLAAAEAMGRLGKPPARIAPLVRPGVLVAIADVGGRAVVLFLSREGGRMAVLGMHD